MQKFTLQAKLRDQKQSVAALRATGLVPVELYGHKVDNVHLAVDRLEFERVFKRAGATSIVEVQIEGNGVRPVLIQDVSRHHTKETAMHVDFYQVNLAEKLTAGVPLKFVGEAKVVREQGAVLVELLREVEVECLPTDLPHEIEVDISGLASLEDVILVSDIHLPANVVMITSLEEVVLNVQAARDLEKELSAPAEVVSAADVEVEKKGKKEDEPSESVAK